MASNAPLRYGLVRVDDRLVHGQVVVSWVRWLRPAHLVLVDDQAAADPVLSTLLREAAPEDPSLWIGSVTAAAGWLSAASLDPARCLVLLRSVDAAHRLYQGGVRYATLNLGAIGFRQGRRRFGAQVALDHHEVEALRFLVAQGVDVSIQAVPADRPQRPAL